MTYFWPGVAAIWGALLSGLTSMYFYFRVDRGRKDLLHAARSAYATFVTCILAASGVLLALLLQHRFDVSYVNSYSSRDLPLHFLISTFWGGQEGSFLLWCFWGALIGLVVWRSAKEMEAPVMIVYLATFLGIVAILCKQSPFRILPGAAPEDGVGLNPLLQDPWMVIHPPVMFSGFASLSVPFAFAIAALWKKRWDGWVVRAIPWALFTFVTLGTAILMGGYWAYKTLGWGGYWGWDPVENTSLVPWLLTAALVHGMYLQRSKKRHRKVNLILACLAFVAILYGTFLTRSGILADFSVHSFVDLGITAWLVGILLGFLGLGLGMIAFRWRSIPTLKEEEPPILSRGVLFILGIAAFCALAFVIILGTSAPLLTRLTGNPSQVLTGFYNKTTTPAAALIVLFCALVPFVGWKGETWRGLLKSSVRSLIVGVVAIAVAYVAGAHEPVSLLLVGLSLFAADMNLRAVIRKSRDGRFGGAGGYLAHVGVGIFLAGVVISGVYAVSKRVMLPINQEVKVGDSTLTFLRVIPGTATTKQAMEVRVKSPEGKIAYAYPKMYVNTKTNQMMANPAIRNSPLFDFYVAPQSYDPGTPEQIGREVRLVKGTTTNIDGTGFTFRDFNADRSAMMKGEKTVLVLTDLTITPPDGTRHDVTIKYMFHIDRGEGESPEQEIPGIPGGHVQVLAVSPNDGNVVVRLLGVSKNPADEHRAATTESLSVDVTRKPLISLVWGGFYVMMAGALVALFKRVKETRKAVMSESTATVRVPAEPVPPAGSPIPVHSRSRI